MYVRMAGNCDQESGSDDRVVENYTSSMPRIKGTDSLQKCIAKVNLLGKNGMCTTHVPLEQEVKNKKKKS